MIIVDMINLFLDCVILILMLTAQESSTASGRALINDESRLMSDLFRDYNRNVRPLMNVSRPVQVSIAFYLTKILALEEKNQILTTFGWLEVHWLDEFLTWKPEEYGGLTRIIVPPQLIWLPDFGLENSADTIYDDAADRKFRAGVDSDGSIQWVPGGKFTTSCQLDITYYPFDTQHCELDFVDWTYDGRFVTLINGSDVIDTSVFRRHGEWDVVGTQALSLSQVFDSDPGISFPTVKFRLCLKRKPRFYLINIVAPCILMSILDLLVFYLPSDSGEKVSLGMTVLLSFSVFLLLIAENVPKTSDCVPLIGVYLTMVMAVTASSIVVSVLVLDLHHREPTSTVPPWLRRLALDLLGRVLCVVPHPQRPPTEDRHGRGHANKATHRGQHHNASKSSRGYRLSMTNNATSGLTYPSDDGEDENRRLEDRQRDTNGVKGIGQVQKAALVSSCNADEAGSTTLASTLDEILRHMRHLTQTIKDQARKEEVKDEWRLVAKVLDRILLIFFVISISALTISILYVYPNTVGNSTCTLTRDWPEK